jgi:hypothetical protein
MSEKIIVQLDLEKGDVKSATASLEKAAERSGERAGSLFSSEFESSATRSLKSIGSFAAKATGIITGLATGFLALEGLRGAQAQEDAVNALNSALILSKNASIQASEGIQAFASELQNSTRFGDDVIIQNAALIQSLGDLDEKGLKRATQATLDLATALRIDLNSAATLMGKAAAGEVGAFSRYGLSIEKAKDNATTFANALTAIESKFGGAAARDVNTYSGAVDQLKNAFGDTLEAIANIIIKSPQFTQTIKSFTGLFIDLTKRVEKFSETFDFFKFSTTLLVEFNDAFITYVIAPFEQLYNIANVVQKNINFIFAQIISGAGNVGFAVAKVLKGLGIGDQLAEDLLNFEQTSEMVTKEVEADFNNAISNISNFSFSDSLAQKNEELRMFFEEQNRLAQDASTTNSEILASSNAVAGESLITWKQAFLDAFSSVSSGAMTLQQQIVETNNKMKTFAAESIKALRDGLARGAGQAFAAFGKAIATGENALDAFAKALFKSIADQAVALGTNFILTGTAMLFSPNPKDQAQAPFLIKSGAALAAFGGFLGGMAGGGGGTATSGNTGIGEGNVPLTNNVANPEASQERQAPGTNVSVTVQGSLVRQEELGQFITETLNESFAKQGVTLTDARIFA